MSAYPLHYTDNANSWRRMGMLANFYIPSFQTGLIICQAVPFFVVFATALIYHLTSYNIYWLFHTPISWILFLSPIMLTKRNHRYMSAQLPVTAAEKLGFLLITFLIAIPLLIWLSTYIAQWVNIFLFGYGVADLTKEVEASEILGRLGIKSPTWLYVFSVLYSAATIIIVLYYAVVSKYNATLKAIVAYVLVNVLSGMAGVIVAVICAFIGFAKVDSFLENDQASNALMEQVTVYTLAFIGVIVVVAGVIYLVKLYKRLRNCGF